jgi:hypothetical protein
MANFIQTTSIGNLGDYTVIIPSTDSYAFQGSLTLPNIVPAGSQGPGGGAGTGSGGGPQVSSQVVVTIHQNASLIYTGQAGAKGFILPALVCTAGDAIIINLSSSLDQDKQPNAVRLTLSVSEGPL